MSSKNIKDSIVAGRDAIGVVNAKDSDVSKEYNRISDVSNEVDVLRKSRTQSFWISLIVGVVSSLIASYIFHLMVCQ